MNKKTWKDPSVFIKKIHVDETCIDQPYTREIIKRANLPWEIVKEGEQPCVTDKPYPHSLSEGKQHLFLTKNRGEFFKQCPGTREYRCCDYFVLNTGMNCPIDCVYCILQAYLNNPWLSFYVNTEDMTAELDNVLDADKEKLFRIGTGEFTDSLAIDRLTGLSKILVSYMAEKPNAMLELKTKSAVVENLENLNHQGRTVIAWSLNSKKIFDTHELRSATFEERLAAAKQCVDWGYKLAFHFDPVIDHEGWEQQYCDTIDRLYREIPAEEIVWISLGALRYLPSLKEIGTARFPGTQIYFQEFIEGLDGKARYFRQRRTEMYKVIYERLKIHASEKTCIYFCMESDEIWEEVMGYKPDEKGGIPAMLDHAFFKTKY